MSEEKIKELKEMMEIQGANGNWNYDPYMHGMYNGMAFALSLLDGNKPQYREAPKEWISKAA